MLSTVITMSWCQHEQSAAKMLASALKEARESTTLMQNMPVQNYKRANLHSCCAVLLWFYNLQADFHAWMLCSSLVQLSACIPTRRSLHAYTVGSSVVTETEDTVVQSFQLVHKHYELHHGRGTPDTQISPSQQYGDAVIRRRMVLHISHQD